MIFFVVFASQHPFSPLAELPFAELPLAELPLAGPLLAGAVLRQGRTMGIVTLWRQRRDVSARLVAASIFTTSGLETQFLELNSVFSYFLNLYESRFSLLLWVHIFSINCENWYFYSINTSEFSDYGAVWEAGDFCFYRHLPNVAALSIYIRLSTVDTNIALARGWAVVGSHHHRAVRATAGFL